MLQFCKDMSVSHQLIEVAWRNQRTERYQHVAKMILICWCGLVIFHFKGSNGELNAHLTQDNFIARLLTTTHECPLTLNHMCNRVVIKDRQFIALVYQSLYPIFYNFSNRSCAIYPQMSCFTKSQRCLMQGWHISHVLAWILKCQGVCCYNRSNDCPKYLSLAQSILESQGQFRTTMKKCRPWTTAKLTIVNQIFFKTFQRTTIVNQEIFKLI